jgi:hypothetical protein
MFGLVSAIQVNVFDDDSACPTLLFNGCGEQVAWSTNAVGEGRRCRGTFAPI